MQQLSFEALKEIIPHVGAGAHNEYYFRILVAWCYADQLAPAEDARKQGEGDSEDETTDTASSVSSVSSSCDSDSYFVSSLHSFPPDKAFKIPMDSDPAAVKRFIQTKSLVEYFDFSTMSSNFILKFVDRSNLLSAQEMREVYRAALKRDIRKRH